MFVAEFNGAGGDSYATKMLPAHSSYIISAEMEITSGLIAALGINTGADIFLVGDPAGSEDGVYFHNTTDWATDAGGISAHGAPVANQWFKIVLTITYTSGTNWTLDWQMFQPYNGSGVSLFSPYSVTLPNNSSSPLQLNVGGIYAIGLPGEVYRVRSVSVVDGGTHVSVFSDDFSSGTFAAWSSVTGSASIVSMPSPPTPSTIGIRAAFGYAAYETSPSFMRIDDPLVPPLTFNGSTNNVTAFTIDRGRTYELDKTQTGTAQMTLLDSSGVFDPTNTSSALYGQIGPMTQTKIGLLNQAAGTYHDIFTGFIESYDWTMTSDERLMTIQIGLVDGFEPLSRCEIPVGANGTTVFLATSDVQTRIDALLDVAGWPTAAGWRNINTGNVFLQRTVYNPQTSVLAAIQDAADADFPGVANVFMRKDGRVAFFGRYPRFKPALFPQDVQFWTCCDANAVGSFGGATIKDIEWTLDQKNLINACLCYPFAIVPGDIAGQLVTDAGSIASYGIRTKSLPDLLEDGQPSSSFQPALDPNPVAKAYGQYYVDNYKAPQLRISKLEFEATLKSSAATWTFVLGVEIGDIISVYTSNPGGGGFGKGTGEPETETPAQFFVEGIHYVGSLENGAQVITLNLDVSPREWFNFEPWAT